MYYIGICLNFFVGKDISRCEVTPSEIKSNHLHLDAYSCAECVFDRKLAHVFILWQ